jgi:predicted transposase YdaD
MNQIHVQPEEKESIFDCLRREGEERGRREGEERGRRALLELAARLLPHDSADLASITDLDELSRVIDQRLSGEGTEQG